MLFQKRHPETEERDLIMLRAYTRFNNSVSTLARNHKLSQGYTKDVLRRTFAAVLAPYLQYPATKDGEEKNYNRFTSGVPVDRLNGLSEKDIRKWLTLELYKAETASLLEILRKEEEEKKASTPPPPTTPLFEDEDTPVQSAGQEEEGLPEGSRPISTPAGEPTGDQEEEEREVIESLFIRYSSQGIDLINTIGQVEHYDDADDLIRTVRRELASSGFETPRTHSFEFKVDNWVWVIAKNKALMGRVREVRHQRANDGYRTYYKVMFSRNENKIEDAFTEEFPYTEVFGDKSDLLKSL